MDYHSFSPLYVSNLTIAGIYSLTRSTLDLAKPLISELSPISVAAYSQLELANNALGLGMNKSQKSAFTPQVKLFDKERDTFISEAVRISKSYLKSSDPLKKAAATTMHLFLAPYRGIVSQPVNIETGSVADMVAKYKARPDLVAAAKTLGIDNVFTLLEAKNNELNATYVNRNAEYAESDAAASEFKPATVTTYIQFCTSIEQAYNYAPTDTIIALFNKMDEYRKIYHGLEGGKDATPTPDATTTK